MREADVGGTHCFRAGSSALPITANLTPFLRRVVFIGKAADAGTNKNRLQGGRTVKPPGTSSWKFWISDLRHQVRGRTVAQFDVQLTPDCRLYDLRLIVTDDGRYLSYAPNSHGRRVATFTPSLANDISRAASAAFREGIACDQTSTA